MILIPVLYYPAQYKPMFTENETENNQRIHLKYYIRLTIASEKPIISPSFLFPNHQKKAANKLDQHA